jgi:ABC-type spermidine/putrescine transport system permease subunit II
MRLPHPNRGNTGWWFVLIGCLTALVGVGFGVLDARGIHEVSRDAWIVVPMVFGAVVVAIGLVLGIRGERLD